MSSCWTELVGRVSESVSEVRTLLVSESEVLTFSLSESVSELLSASESIYDLNGSFFI